MRSSIMKRAPLALLAALSAVAMLALPASAGDPPATVTCTGTDADVNADSNGDGLVDGDGLLAVGGDSRYFEWTFDSGAGGCTVVDSNGQSTGRLQANGNGQGNCGRSVGFGSGTFTYDVGTSKAGTVVNLEKLAWTSVGTNLVVHFTHDAGGQGSGEAAVNARSDGQAATGSCFDHLDPTAVTDGETEFDVDIEATLV